MSLNHWHHKCPLILSSPHDFCICVKQNKVFVQDENGNLEKWLQVDNVKYVEKVFKIASRYCVYL